MEVTESEDDDDADLNASGSKGQHHANHPAVRPTSCLDLVLTIFHLVVFTTRIHRLLSCFLNPAGKRKRLTKRRSNQRSKRRKGSSTDEMSEEEKEEKSFVSG
jgi:hypothetical protein